METTDTLRSPERGVNYLLIRNTFGCEDSLVFHVTLLPSLQLDTGLIIQPNCLIDNGSIEVSYSGGTAPYTYQWSVKESADAPSIGFLGPGKYQVDIRDKNGCTRFDTFFLINQDIYRIQAAYRAPTCLGDQNGWIALSVFPDTFKQVEYTWFNGFAGASINNLAQGIYSVTVDADGCYQEVSLALNDPPFFSLVALPPLKGCEGELGSIMPMVFGGVPPYRFELNGQLFQLDTTVLFIENIGIQRLTVSDSLGCAREQELLPEVFPEPEVFASMDTTIVKGNPVILRLEGFEQYAWTNVPADVCRNCPEIRFTPETG
ncbi:MAG: SprB repeat-containing protein [Haliscomenobacter sp.]|nr:SprB repeat-containing protein [Haliscomenobacter sp.]